MIYELDSSEYGRVRPLYEPLGFHLNCQAVLDGYCWGRVFTDDWLSPRASFMVAAEACYLAGDPKLADFNEALNETIQSGEAIHNDPSPVFVASVEEWFGKLMVGLGVVQTFARRHYVCKRVRFDWRMHVPNGCEVRQMDEGLLSRNGLPEHIQRWVRHNWETPETFLAQGFGFVTMQGDQIVAWSLADCVTYEACEIGIHTQEAYRRQGLATVTAGAAVAYALDHGYEVVGWQCDEDNVGSIGTAEKVGFELERRYTMAMVERG